MTRKQRIERISKLRSIVKLGRGAVRLFRRHKRTYINRVERFMLDYEYVKPQVYPQQHAPALILKRKPIAQ
jgi:hypothetical protein